MRMPYRRLLFQHTLAVGMGIACVAIRLAPAMLATSTHASVRIASKECSRTCVVAEMAVVARTAFSAESDAAVAKLLPCSAVR